jgi:hypothetical protein
MLINPRVVCTFTRQRWSSATFSSLLLLCEHQLLQQYQHVITTVPGVRRRKYCHRRCRRSSGRQSSGFRAEACAGPSPHREAGVAGAAAAVAVGGAVDDGYAGGQRQPREATAEDSRRAGEGESWRTPKEVKHFFTVGKSVQNIVYNSDRGGY